MIIFKTLHFLKLKFSRMRTQKQFLKLSGAVTLTSSRPPVGQYSVVKSILTNANFVSRETE